MNNITMKLNVDKYLLMALEEDISSEDVSTNAVMPEYKKGTVDLICKEDGIIAGLDVFGRVFHLLDTSTEVDYKVKDGDEVKKGQLMATVTGDIRDTGIFKSLSVELNNSQKKVKINNNDVSKISDYITNLNVVLVSPEDINILQGTPAERRNFLNIELSQISKNYIKKYNEFNKILKIRNNYLKMLYNISRKKKIY